MHTTCSLTLNAAASMISCPRADLPRERTTQTHRETFSAHLLACLVAARAVDNLGRPPSNQGKGQMPIASLATYLKTYVSFPFPLHLSLPSPPPPLPTQARQDCLRFLVYNTT